MQRASLRNEGKIHLGFVYAADESARTPVLMLDAALAFAPLVERWTGTTVPWRRLRSRPFVYAVVRDSMISVERLQASYTALQEVYELRRDGSCPDYLGERPARLWREATRGPDRRGHVARFFETEEVALKPCAFREFVAGALAGEERVQACYGHEVRGVSRTPAGFRVEGSRADGKTFSIEADTLVNCLWEQRLVFDHQLGVRPPRRWVHRLKFRVRGRLPSALRALPSFTYVLGPYGDIVAHDDGEVNMSWYPVCRRGWSEALAPPEEWAQICKTPPPQIAASVAAQTLAQFDRFLPGLGATRVEGVDAGVIFSWGGSDIDDPASALHARSDIGVQEHDGYFSINTGKFTTAPLFAEQLAGRLA